MSKGIECRYDTILIVMIDTIQDTFSVQKVLSFNNLTEQTFGPCNQTRYEIANHE